MIIVYIAVFLYGIVVGSFLNVVILRQGRESLLKPSHCMSCGHRLNWRDLIPIISYMLLKGRCRYCKSRISPQYFMVELANGLLWVLTFVICGISIKTALFCLVCSALIVISVTDRKTYEIPVTANAFIMGLGAITTGLAEESAWEHLLGAFIIAVPLLIVLIASGGNAMGGGDVKLMAAAGLCLGWKQTTVGFILGCFLAVVFHLIRMIRHKADNRLAFGPYLSAGIILAMWFGPAIISLYVRMFEL